MLVEIKGMQKILQLSKGEPDNFCRPAVDPILGSVAKAYGGRALGVMLKAGYDEYKGSRVIGGAPWSPKTRRAASSGACPVWLAMGGLCSAVLPLDDIAPHVMTFLSRRPR
jgi:two-component system chemotaxis response regulator CheB